MQEKGNLSINSENFLPIIKKWLYTDKDIFIRELVSNACDAVTKLQKLNMMGEADIPTDEKYEIHVVLDQDNKTLQIMDNGIGMTADEIKKYINQIAFSGATDFLAKYKDKTKTILERINTYKDRTERTKTFLKNYNGKYYVAKDSDKVVGILAFQDSKEAKYKAIVQFVKEKYEKGQPVLIGTIAIETSELISEDTEKKVLESESTTFVQTNKEISEFDINRFMITGFKEIKELLEELCLQYEADHMEYQFSVEHINSRESLIQYYKNGKKSQ